MEGSGNQWGESHYRVLHHVHALNRGLQHNVNICQIWEYAPGAQDIIFHIFGCLQYFIFGKRNKHRAKKEKRLKVVELK